MSTGVNGIGSIRLDLEPSIFAIHLWTFKWPRGSRRLLLHAQLNNKRKTITPSHARFRFLRFLIRHRQFGNAAAHVESQSEISSVTTAGSGWGTGVSGAVGSLRLRGGRDQPAPPP